MTRKLVYEALDKLQRGEIMKPDVMDVIDSWLKAEILELNATNSGLRYAASELEFRVDKQSEHIAILQDQLKEAENHIRDLDSYYGQLYYDINYDKTEMKETDEQINNHLDNIKFMMALYGNSKTYVECQPQDEGAFNIPNSNRWLREFNIKIGVRWQKVKMRNEIIDWLYNQNIGMEFIKEFEQFLSKTHVTNI